MLTWDYENTYRAQGFAVIAGTDEAGRGPLAGPVCAAACILPSGWMPSGLNDSKKVSEKKREILFEEIIQHAVDYAVAYATPEEIDTLNILNASQLAMRRAVSAMKHTPDLVLVDGNIAREFPVQTVTIVGGDGKSPSIAAASILAKVSRDRLCLELDAQYPEYGFARHKGYPTKEHMEAVRRLGPSPCHRKSFLGFLQKDT